MRRNILVGLLLLLACVVKAESLSNIALKAASLSASANSDQTSRLADNNRSAYWSSYTGDESLGKEQYVEFAWDYKCFAQTISVYWAESSPNILLPTSARVEYWDATSSTWKQAAALPTGSNLSTLTVALTTSRIRIYMKSRAACGIKEVRIIGYCNADPAEPFTWKPYSSKLDYNYRYDYPNGVPAPTKFLPENNGQVGMKVKGWWAFAWGPKRNKYVTDEAIEGLLDKMNNDFGYFRDSLGWLPDKRARRGYYSTVYLYGSGLYSDPADSTALGGWQSATWFNGENWPMVNLSYYPVACFDPDFTYDSYHNAAVNDQTAQQNACVHEGIHAVFADLEGCKNSAWFQESGNTSMQADAELSKTPNVTPTSMGFLSAGTMIAPFMPIECYSGWLLDGSLGGPSAEGVNLFRSDGQQICTWRKLLGGVQYSELFAHFLTVRFSQNTLPWIWRYCKDRVLSGIADTLGDAQTRQLVREFRVKQATIDLGKWSNASRALLDNNWQLSIKQEWSPYMQEVEEWKATPYVNMYACDAVDSARWWKPEARTCPGWSGANQIPLHVNYVKGDTIRIHFLPKGPNMECQLCYRSKRGRIYYSKPCSGEGDVAMVLNDQPANDVVFAVVVNTDYIYTGEEQRKSHYDYRLQMKDNVYQPASPSYRWYHYTYVINDKTFDKDAYTGIQEVTTPGGGSKFKISADCTDVRAGSLLPLHFEGVCKAMLQVRLHAADGRVIKAQSFLKDGNFSIPSGLTKGLYILEAHDHGNTSAVKLFIH